MDKQSRHIERILKKHLPPFAFRAGYSTQYINPFPPGLQHVNIDYADRDSLETFFLRFKHGPSDFNILSGLLDKLAPGGIAFLVLDEGRWTLRQMKDICTGMGFQIQHFKSFQSYKKKEILAVLQKPSYISKSSRKKIISIILPFYGSSSYDKSADSWQQFLEKKDLLEISEIIVVDDGILRNESIVEIESRSSSSSINFIGHYMPFGRLAAIRTGMLHAKGRYILVDESREGVHPGEIFPLLNAMMHKSEKKEMPGCAVGVRSWNPATRKKSGRSLRELYAKFICGSLKPYSNFRMFHFQLAGNLFESSLKDHKIQPLLLLKKKHIPICDVFIEGTVSQEKDPGFLKLTALKFASFFQKSA